jgi:hypothetical protein
MTSHSEVVPLDVGGMLNELAGMPPHLEVRFVDESNHPKRHIYSFLGINPDSNYIWVVLNHSPPTNVMYLVAVLTTLPLYKEVFLGVLDENNELHTYMCTPGEATQDAYTFQLHERI